MIAQILVGAFWTGGKDAPPHGLGMGETGVEAGQLLAAEGLGPAEPSRLGLAVALVRYASIHGEPAAWLPALRATLAADGPVPGFAARARADLRALFPGMPAGRAERAFAAATGARPGPLSGSAAVRLIHIYGMWWARVHQIPYRAEPGDSFTDIALAGNLTVAQARADNPFHGGVLWVGQRVRFRPPPPPPPPPSPTVPSSPAAGVIAAVRPVAGLALLNPSARVVRELDRAPVAVRAIALVTTGEWALWHAPLVRAWSVAGGTWAVDGYSTTKLGSLPPMAIRQELRWSQAVIRQETGGAVPYVIPVDSRAAALVAPAASALGLEMVKPTVTVDPPRQWPAGVAAALTRHEQALVAAVAPARLNWFHVVEALRLRHIVLETLDQIAYG